MSRWEYFFKVQLGVILISGFLSASLVYYFHRGTIFSVMHMDRTLWDLACVGMSIAMGYRLTEIPRILKNETVSYFLPRGLNRLVLTYFHEPLTKYFLKKAKERQDKYTPPK